MRIKDILPNKSCNIDIRVNMYNDIDIDYGTYLWDGYSLRNKEDTTFNLNTMIDHYIINNDDIVVWAGI